MRTDAAILEPMAQRDFVSALARGLMVLESFATDRQRINATIAAQRTGMARAAARRHLLTLSELGYLETDGSYFWLTPKVLRFSGSYLASARLPRILQPTLNRLAAETDQSFSTAVLDGDEAVIIGRSGPSRLLAHGLHLGARLPAHATSTGRVLLSALPQRIFRQWLKTAPLHRLTAKTVIDPKAFSALIDRVRDDDFCMAEEEHELGVRAIAVPLRNARGTTVAAINVVLSGTVVPGERRMEALLDALRSGAQELRTLI